MTAFSRLLLRKSLSGPALLWLLKQSGVEEADFPVSVAIEPGKCWTERWRQGEPGQQGCILMAYWFHLVNDY